MSDNELKIIKNHLAMGKMTTAVKDAISNCLEENRKLTIENDTLLKQRKQLFNRCKVLSQGTLCFFCGFKNECLQNEDGAE